MGCEADAPWGLDHGAWVPLSDPFPARRIDGDLTHGMLSMDAFVFGARGHAPRQGVRCHQFFTRLTYAALCRMLHSGIPARSSDVLGVFSVTAPQK